MNCLSCGYHVDRYSPDKKFCSCACKTYWKLGLKYPIQKSSKISSDLGTLKEQTDL